MCLAVRHISGEYSLIFLSATHWFYVLDTVVAIALHSAINSTEFACKVMFLMFLRKWKDYFMFASFFTCGKICCLPLVWS